MNESKLIRRCLEKDKKAWGIFIEKYSRLVYWAIRKRLAMSNFQCDESDIDDIFQEVFLIILKGDKLQQVKDVKFIPGWLSMVASNKAVDFMRQKVRQEQSLVIDNFAFKDCSFEQDLLSRDTVSAIKTAIGDLSHKEKIVISLNLLEERTHKEISHILKIPINTVSTIIARSKDKLKEELKKRGLGEVF